ncbi:MAG: M23 family metallopeptidase [Bacteroidaceae bacterium]|nr:M23 family metallopeptidase [Bacteroidaceae bacterium]
MRKILFLISLLSAVPSLVRAQSDSIALSSPFSFELLLSGNFGELRSNHFHAGIDFKTQGAVGRPILAPADGYISRATVTAGGYGRAIYVTHNNGYITVYGHLDSFIAPVAERVRQQQYSGEYFAVDVSFDEGEYRVMRGDTIAFAGNSGYSFGPHLHFEVRANDGSLLVSPMRFYLDKLTDTKAPRVQAVALTPRQGQGIVEGGCSTVVRKVVQSALRDTLQAWGWVGFSLKCDDIMNNTSNKYGVYSVELFVDDSLRFCSRMDEYPIADTRFINASVDYPRYFEKGEWFWRSYILENNPLPILSADKNRGWVDIDQERLYNVKYRIADFHGNITQCNFVVEGKCDTIQQPCDTAAHYLYWFINNTIAYEGMRLDVPSGQLFENTALAVQEQPSRYGISRCYSFGSTVVPLRKEARISLQVNDTLGLDSSKLYICRLMEKGHVAVGGEYKDGRVTANVPLLATYEVAVDTVPPSVKPVAPKNWARNGQIVFSVGDKGRGIKSFKGLLDGKFILFEYSSKSGRLTCNMRREKVRRGKHQLLLTVTDNAGNTTTIERTITY